MYAVVNRHSSEPAGFGPALLFPEDCTFKPEKPSLLTRKVRMPSGLLRKCSSEVVRKEPQVSSCVSPLNDLQHYLETLKLLQRGQQHYFFGIEFMNGYPCPYCHQKPLETVATAPYVRGFIAAYQAGSKTFIGCVPCVRKKVLGEAALSLFIGWFSITALILNPFMIVYNLSRHESENL